MHHPTDRIGHTTAFVTPVVEHWLERELEIRGEHIIMSFVELYSKILRFHIYYLYYLQNVIHSKVFAIILSCLL